MRLSKGGVIAILVSVLICFLGWFNGKILAISVVVVLTLIVLGLIYMVGALVEDEIKGNKK